MRKKTWKPFSPKGPARSSTCERPRGTRAPCPGDTPHDLREGPAQQRPRPAAARLPPGHSAPREAQRRQERMRVGLRPARRAGPRSAPRVFRSARARNAPAPAPAPAPGTRARPRSRTDAAERFPRDTRGRSPAAASAVARVVARTGRGAGPAAKGPRGRAAGRS